MAKWKACTQVNGEEFTSFLIYEFEVPNSLYEKAMQLIEDGVPLNDTGVMNELCRYAESSFNIKDAVPEYDAEYQLDESEPEREYYDSDEEYEEALEEFEDYKRINEESYYDDFFIELTLVEDPGEFIRFKNLFIGKKICEGWKNTEDVEDQREGKVEFDYPFGDGFDTYCTINYLYDSNGIITEIFEPIAEACVGETVNSSSFDSIFPDYDECIQAMEEELDVD